MNFSNIQEWVDGFSALQNYSRVSIDAWYKLRPQIKSYPGTFSAINPGFNDSIIDNAVITLATSSNAKEIDFAKNRLVDRMKEYFSVSDMKVVDMNSAIDSSRNQNTDAAITSPGKSVDNKPDACSSGKSGTYSYDQSDLVSYIANKYNMGSDEISAALQEFSSQPYPMSRVTINNFLCNRYNFPINNDGEVVSRISRYLTDHIDIRDEKLDRLTIAKSVINKYIPADNFLVMDILNAYMDPRIPSSELSHILFNLFQSCGSFVPEHLINQIILSLSDTFKRYEMEKQDLSPKDFARKEAISILNQTCKDHRLKLAANEVKWVYDSYLANGMDAKKTAPLITGIETESGRVLYEDTARDVLEDFRNRVRDQKVTDGHHTFSKKNFNNTAESVVELSDLASAAGIDDRFVIDNFDELKDILVKATSTKDLLSAISSYLLLKNYVNTPEEADLISQDFVSILKESSWAQSNMRNLSNFSRNDLINRMFSLGYSERDIAIKLHEPLSSIRNFAKKDPDDKEDPSDSYMAQDPGGFVNKTVDWLQGSKLFNWLTPQAMKVGTNEHGDTVYGPDRFTFLSRLGALGLGTVGLAMAAKPLIKEAYRKFTGKKKTQEEMYEEIRDMIEEDRRFRGNSGRIATALSQLASGAAHDVSLGIPPGPLPSPVPPLSSFAPKIPSPSGIKRPI